MIQDLIPDTLTPYGDWYKIGGYNRLGRECYAMIGWRNAPTNVTEIPGAGDSPIELSSSFADKDFFDPVSGTSCTIKIQATSYDEFIRLARGDDTEFRVRVVEKDANNNDVVLFRGFLRPETYRQDYGAHRPSISVDATDGLGLLRDIYFPRVDEVPIYGREYVNHIMSYILYRAGNRENWLDYVNYKFSATTMNFTRSLQLPTVKYYEWSLYEVLEDILNILKAQIIQVSGKYAIRLMDRPSDMYVEEYTYKGNLVGGTTADAHHVNLYDNYEGAVGQLSVERPVNKLILENRLKPIPNLVYNGDFKRGDSGWTSGEYDPLWNISDNTLKIEEKPGFYDFGTTSQDMLQHIPAPYVQTITFDRGDIVPGYGFKLLLSFDVSKASETSFTSYFVKVAAGDVTNWQRWRLQNVMLPGDGFYTVTFPLTLRPDDNKTVAISQVWRVQAGSGPNNQYKLERTHIKNVRVQVVDTVLPPFHHPNPDADMPERPEEIIRDEIIDLNSGNSEEREVDVGWLTGNPYVHDNALWNFLLYHNTWLFPSVLWANTRSRHRWFYRQSRQRLNIDLYQKQESQTIHPYTQLFDRYLKRIFVPMSYTYNLLKNSYNAELVEFRKATEDEFMTWILADGTWDDDGYWMDAEQWHDTNPN